MRHRSCTRHRAWTVRSPSSLTLSAGLVGVETSFRERRLSSVFGYNFECNQSGDVLEVRRRQYEPFLPSEQ